MNRAEFEAELRAGIRRSRRSPDGARRAQPRARARVRRAASRPRGRDGDRSRRDRAGLSRRRQLCDGRRLPARRARRAAGRALSGRAALSGGGLSWRTAPLAVRVWKARLNCLAPWRTGTPMSEIVTIELKHETRRALDRLAQQTNRLVDDLVNRAVRDYLDFKNRTSGKSRLVSPPPTGVSLSPKKSSPASSANIPRRNEAGLNGRAARDLEAIGDYIARHNSGAAQETIRQICSVTQIWSHTLNLGRPGRVPNTRELVVGSTPFIVGDRVVDDRVDILAVFHNTRNVPDTF